MPLTGYKKNKNRPNTRAPYGTPAYFVRNRPGKGRKKVTSGGGSRALSTK